MSQEEKYLKKEKKRTYSDCSSDDEFEDDESTDEEYIFIPKDKEEKKIIELQPNMRETDIFFFRQLNKRQKKDVLLELGNITTIYDKKKPYLFKILDMKVSLSNKAELLDKIKRIDINSNSKFGEWIEQVFKIPFGIYIKEEMNLNTSKKDISKFLNDCHQTLDNCIYGHSIAKNKILQVIAQNISNSNPEGIILGLKGPMGNGKTTLIEKGVSTILNRPFSHISLGGANDASFLEGHSYTYEGSLWGKIADILIKSKCMNPIIYFDELDKVSCSSKGDEIINILIHLTDPSQNKFFQDKYFGNLDLDLSKCIFIFSYNNSCCINPILMDRITEIETKGFKLDDKCHIANSFLLPSILNEVGFKANEIVFDDNVIEYIIENYTNEGGVRKLKEKLFEIVREINLRKLKNNKQIKYVSIKIVKDIFSHLYSIYPCKIHSSSEIGKINGLYATSNNTGGILPIEVKKIPFTDNKTNIMITGNQGNIMKESIEVANTLAKNLIADKNKMSSLHIHCAEASSRKEGPSAGTAITICIISALLEIPIYNDIGITGEIDLNGNILEIGGLEDKLFGAKKAGIKKVYCPLENKHHLKKIMKEHKYLVDKDFKVVCVNHISEVLDRCLEKNNYKF